MNKTKPLVLLLLTVLSQGCALTGNPIGEASAHRSVRIQLEREFPDAGLELGSTGYDYKTGSYRTTVYQNGEYIGQ